MRHYRLTNQEAAGTGFTDQFVIEASELNAAGTSQAFVLKTLGAAGKYAIVDDVAVIRVDEAFAGTAGANLKAELGHNALNGSGSADPNYWVDQSDIKATAGTLYGSVSVAEDVATPRVTTLNGTVAGAAVTEIDCTITTSGAGAANFSTTTASHTGKISIFMRIVMTDDLGTQRSQS